MAALDQTAAGLQVDQQGLSPLAQEERQAEASQSREQAASRAAKTDGEIMAIRMAARASLAETLRASRGVEAPGQAPLSAQDAPQGTQRAEATPDMSAQLAAQFALQTQEAQRLRAEADSIKSTAEQRAQAAEAKLASMLKNPAAFLQESGLDLDQWNARLAQTGGEATEQEKMMAAVEARVKIAEAKTDALVNQSREREQVAQRAALTASLGPIIADQFPAIDAMLGVGGFLDHLVTLQRANPGKPVNAEQVVQELEASFQSDLQRVLGNEKLRAKLAGSVSTPQAEYVASQGPRTISNKVTSSVSVTPSSGGLPSLAERRAAAHEIIKRMMDNR